MNVPYRFIISRGSFQAFLLVCALSMTNLTAGEPYVPKDDGAVLERVPLALFDANGNELRKLIKQLAQDPADLEMAMEVARQCIQRSRAKSNSRFLGYAEAALRPWWHSDQIPPDALVLRATLRQTQHEFDAALKDLDAALKADPSHTQAWLTRVTILQVQGRYEEAKRSCLALARLASELVAVTAVSSVASLTGDPNSAYTALRSILAKHPDAPGNERLWAWTVLAEIAVRMGNPQAAGDHFQTALKLAPKDSYALAAYADLLLDLGRSEDVISLLKDHEQIDALLLRLARAEKQLGQDRKQWKRHAQSLQDRFAASRMRNAHLHAREEAYFTLHLLNDPEKALELAKANWQIQKEPADARILLDAARAANDSTAQSLVPPQMKATL